LAEARKALAISPNNAGTHHLLGATLLFSGQPRAGIEAIRKAMRLDPLGPAHPDWLGNIAIARYFMGEYDAAVEAAKAALRSNPDQPCVPSDRNAARAERAVRPTQTWRSL
jgi:Flp pilus assembly protein TadD